jgi:hypothetical protein
MKAEDVMSMFLNVVGIRPVDEKYKQMKTIWDACISAGIEVPDKVNEYFDWEEPNENGVVVDIRNSFVERNDWNIVVDITKLPPDVTLIEISVE